MVSQRNDIKKSDRWSEKQDRAVFRAVREPASRSLASAPWRARSLAACSASPADWSRGQFFMSPRGRLRYRLTDGPCRNGAAAGELLLLVGLPEDLDIVVVFE